MKNGKMPYSTPEGYFDNLQERLSLIPAAERRRRVKMVAAATAASFAAAALLIVSLRLPAVAEGRTALSEGLSDDEIVEYLIDAGSSACYFEDVI